MQNTAKTYHQGAKKSWITRKKGPDFFRAMQKKSVLARKRNKIKP